MRCSSLLAAKCPDRSRHERDAEGSNHRHLLDEAHGGSRWAAQLAPTVAIEAVLAWLDAGRPDPETAAERIRAAIMGVVEAAGRR